MVFISPSGFAAPFYCCTLFTLFHRPPQNAFPASIDPPTPYFQIPDDVRNTSAGIYNWLCFHPPPAIEVWWMFHTSTRLPLHRACGVFFCFCPRAKQEDADLGEVQHFALKALAKKAVVDRGQLAHVKDEKLLLQNMSHPLILGIFSTFQVRPCAEY